MPEHEGELQRLLDELGGILLRRERLLDRERRRRNRMRMEQIAEEARNPFAELDRETLVRDLERELGYERLQAQELREALQLARLRSRAEDGILRELSRHLPGRDLSLPGDDLRARLRRRDRLLAAIPELPPKEARKSLDELESCQQQLDGLLYGLVERRLLALHREGPERKEAGP